MVRKLMLFAALLIPLLVWQPATTLKAQTEIQIGNQTSAVSWFPYSQYYYYTFYRSAIMYSGHAIREAGGGPGRITQIAFNTCNSAQFYKNWYTMTPASLKLTRVYCAIADYANFPYLPANRTYTNLIEGNAPWGLRNIQMVYEGPMWDEDFDYESWAPIEFQNPYLYLDGNLVIIIERNFTQQRDYPGYPQYADEGGCFYYSYISGSTPNETNTLYTGMRWLQWGTTNTDATNQGVWMHPYRPNIRITLQQGIEESFPEDVDPRRILRSNFLYNQDALRTSPTVYSKPYIRFRGSDGQQVEFTYKIRGPLPSNDIIYEATTPGGNPTITYTAATQGLHTVYMPWSNGNRPAAHTDNNGNVIGGGLDLNGIQGGAYRVEVVFNSQGFIQNWVKDFVITFDNDIAVREIVAPFSFSERNYKYPRNIQIPVSGKFQNVGLNNVTKFKATAQIYNQSGTLVYEDETIWNGSIATGEIVTIEFASFTNTGNVGDYDICMNVELLSANDQGATNNQLCSDFKIQHEIEVAAVELAKPNGNSSLYTNRPITPEGLFSNVGISDLSNVPVKLLIYNSNNDVVYEDYKTVPNLPNGEQPIPVLFNDFLPRNAGAYRAELCVNFQPGVDPIPANDCVSSTFSVNPQLSGNYTIGLGGDFQTIQDAVDELYTCGVSGPVNFILTDAQYTVGGPSSAVALDMTSRIIGVSAQNPVTFKPSVTRAASRGSINIDLEAADGIGIFYGQSHPEFFRFNINPHAVVWEFPKNKSYAHSSGFISWDGGENSSIRMRLKSNSPFRAPFYLGQGASNYTVKNIIIENHPASAPSYATNLPQQMIRDGSAFLDEEDVRVIGGDIRTYSAGVVIRNTMPYNPALNDNNFNNLRLDTLVNTNNVVMNNEIRGFGYGVAALGIGTLYRDGDNPAFERFYSRNTQIRNNVISNVARAGVYLGYQENASVRGNRIYNVGTGVGHSGDAAGVMAGNDGRYNNVNLVIAENEISGISSDRYAGGVVLSQNLNQFVHPFGNIVTAPPANSNNRAFSNVVWGLSRSNQSASMAGIHFRTTRDPNATGANALYKPMHADYYTEGDFIANNTVVVSDNVTNGSGALIGVGVQQAKGAKLYNNAIAMTGAAASTQFVHTALLFEGTDPRREGGLVSDRNAFWTPNASLAYMVELTKDNQIIEVSNNSTFKNLQQWKALSNQDNNSVYGNFVQDHVFVGNAPQSLRVNTNPAPLGSILNNRGFRVQNLTIDIDGELRGQAEQRYDIGADEFTGRQHLTDLEAVEILSPRTYRRSEGTFSDAEYVMTEAPVSIDAIFYNPGAMPQTGVKVTATVYLETPTSNNQMLIPAQKGSAVVSQELRIDVPEGGSAEVNFDLSDNFAPRSYADLGWAAPAMYQRMTENVSPRYILEVKTVSDQNVANNVVSKAVRFFISKSRHNLIVAIKNGTANISSSTDLNVVAGRLNGDSLIAGMNDLNQWYDQNDFDILDRSGWEPYGVNYSTYRTVIWSHDMQPLSRLERDNLRDFIATGKESEKKNLLFSSQDVARLHQGQGVAVDQSFVNQVLRAQLANQGTPLAAAPAYYNEKGVVGDNVSNGIPEVLRNTGFNMAVRDVNPQPTLLRIYSDESTRGPAEAAYRYLSVDAGANSDIMGISVAGVAHNVVFYGADFRHFGRTDRDPDKSGVQRVLRGAFQEFEDNHGSVLPVELAAFNAFKLNGESVEVLWETASENNSAHFDVERRVLGNQEFFKVGQVAAQGVSTTPRQYTLVDDYNLNNQNVYEYRLRMVDLDGSANYSDIVAVDMRESAGSAAWLGEVRPNPARENVTIEFGLSENQHVSLKIFDLQGNRVQTIVDGMTEKGSYIHDVRVSELPAGVYVYVLQAGETRISKRLRVVR